MKNITRNIKIFLAIFFLVTFFGLLYNTNNANAEAKTIRVGYFAFSGYHNLTSSGRSGYGYDYLQKMALYNNWEYDYLGYDKSWNDMQTMLEKGEIDLLSSAQKTEERLTKFLFSNESIGVSSTLFTVKAGDYTYYGKDYSSFNNIRVGMIEGNSRNDDFASFAKENGFTYHPVYFQSLDELLEELNKTNKTIDSAVTSNLRVLQDEWLISEFASSEYYIMVNKNNQSLLDEVNQAISKIKIDYPLFESELYNKYYVSNNNQTLVFTLEEQTYLNKLNKPIYVLVNPDNSPISFNNKGKWEGSLPILLENIEEKTGINFEIFNIQSNK